MSDELPETPVVPPFLSHVKTLTLGRIVSHMNGVGASVIAAYPMAEVESWPVQKAEAEAVIQIGLDAWLTTDAVTAYGVAPFLHQVTTVHRGSATPQLVWDKVVSVKANADNWATLSAYVNGLRARAQDLIDAAEAEDQVYTIESSIFTELEAFRAVAGI